MVKAMPRKQDPERYFLGYFTGEGLADGEQLRFGLSTGNSALDWVGLGGGKPSLVSQLGDQGLRDPFIIRSHDGDTFYMIATDLNWFNRNRDYQINDSQYIEVFESHDLVNWSPQRHVKVAPGQRRQRVRARGLLGRLDRRLRRVLGPGDVERPGQPHRTRQPADVVHDHARLPHVHAARGVAEPVPAVADRHHGDQGRRLVLPLHQERGGQRGLGRVLREEHATCATPTSPTGPRSPRRSAAARGWPTRATRARWCSRPTRATPPAPSSSTSGRTATPTAAATSCRAARTSRPRSGPPRRRGSPTPAPCATERSRRSRCASGTGSRASPTRTWPPRPTSSLPGAGDQGGRHAHRHGARGGRLRDRRPGALLRAGLGADRLPRDTAWPRSPSRARCAAARRRSRPSTSATTS